MVQIEIGKISEELLTILKKAVVPKAICCFAIVFFYPSTVCIMTDRVLRKILPQRICACTEKKKLDMIILLCSRQKAKNAKKNNDFAMWKLESLFSPPKKFPLLRTAKFLNLKARWLRSPNYMQICHTNVWIKNLTKVNQDLKLRNLSQAADHVTLN